MRKLFRPTSEFALFSILVTVSVVLIFSCICWFLYESNLREWKRKSEAASQRVTQSFQERLLETTKIMTHLGKKIALEPREDIEAICRCIQSSDLNSVRCNPLFTWVFFDWIDSSNRMRANGAFGIFTDPPNMSHREYTATCRETPWTLQVCPPAFGVPSGIWIIPIGLGVQDVEGHHLGIVGGGLHIDSIRQLFNTEIGGEGIEFILIDQDLNFIVQSTGEEGGELTFSKEKISSRFFKDKEGTLASPLSYNQIDYYGLKKVRGYPYVVLTGFDRKVVWREFLRQLFPHFLEIFFILIFSLVILHFFWKKIAGSIRDFSEVALKASRGEFEGKIPEQTSLQMNAFAEKLHQLISYAQKCEADRRALVSAYEELNQRHEEAISTFNLFKKADENKELFLDRLNEEMQSALLVILSYAKGLLKNLTKELDFEISEERQISFLNEIISVVSDLQNGVAPILNLIDINLKTSIEKVVAIHSKEIFLKKVTLHYAIDPSLSHHFLDELKFMQILLGLLSRAIHSVTAGGNIRVEAKVEAQQCLKISISDDGFGLNEEDISRLLEKFSEKRLSRVDPLQLDLAAIEKLVSLHQGSLSIENTWKKGTVVKAFFPSLYKKISAGV